MIDAEESIGDGFSFSGGESGVWGIMGFISWVRFGLITILFLFYVIVSGKYGEGPSKSDEWFAQGKMVCDFVLCLSLFCNWQMLLTWSFRSRKLKNVHMLAPFSFNSLVPLKLLILLIASWLHFVVHFVCVV